MTDVAIGSSLAGHAYALLRRSMSPAEAGGLLKNLATALEAADIASDSATSSSSAPPSASRDSKPHSKKNAPSKSLTEEQEAKKDRRDLARVAAMQLRVAERTRLREAASVAPDHHASPIPPT